MTGDGPEVGSERERQADPEDWEPGVIPSRAVEWESEFPPPDPVQLHADQAVFVATRSPGRRWVALGVTVLAAVWLADVVVDVARHLAEYGETPIRALGVVAILPFVFRLVIGGVATWLVWRWAKRPVVG